MQSEIFTSYRSRRIKSFKNLQTNQVMKLRTQLAHIGMYTQRCGSVYWDSSNRHTVI